MPSIRETLNSKPWIAWVVAAASLTVATLFVTGVIGGGRGAGPQALAEEVTIRCTETGQEWTMSRGEFERELLLSPGQIDPNAGIPSPYAEGRRTGVLVNKREWEATVERINAAKRAYQ